MYRWRQFYSILLYCNVNTYIAYCAMCMPLPVMYYLYLCVYSTVQVQYVLIH